MLGLLPSHSPPPFPYSLSISSLTILGHRLSPSSFKPPPPPSLNISPLSRFPSHIFSVPSYLPLSPPPPLSPIREGRPAFFVSRWLGASGAVAAIREAIYSQAGGVRRPEWTPPALWWLQTTPSRLLLVVRTHGQQQFALKSSKPPVVIWFKWQIHI